jgi:hypothetical protein
MKYIFVTLTILFLLLFAAWEKYPLQDGYTLAGFKGHHGWVFGKNLFPLVSEEVLGVQGCKKGYLFGWVKTGKSFIIKTNENRVIWLSPQEQFKFIETVGCPKNNMDNDINLAGFEMGKRFNSQ